MSTISLPNERQIRHFFLANAFATETTVKAFMDSASIGEVQLFDKDGNAVGYSTGALDKDVYLIKKNNKGGISVSDFITPKDVSYLKGTAPVAKVGKTQTFTLGANPTAGKHYILDLKLHYGVSEENFINFMGDARAKTGETANALLRRIAKSIADNLGDSVHTSAKADATEMTIATTPSLTAKANKYFTISVAGSVLTIQEKDWILDDFRVGLRTMDQIMWNTELMVPGDEDEALNVTKANTPGTFAKGQGYQVIELERYLVGHRAEFETPDIQISFGRQYDTDISKTYYTVDLKYFDVSRDDPKHSDKMLTIASEDPKVIDAIGFAFEAFKGKAEGSIWTELDPAGDGADNVV